MYDRTRTAFTLRVLDGLGLPDPPPRVRVAVRGWVAFTEEVTVDWLAQGDLVAGPRWSTCSTRRWWRW